MAAAVRPDKICKPQTEASAWNVLKDKAKEVFDVRNASSVTQAQHDLKTLQGAAQMLSAETVKANTCVAQLQSICTHQRQLLDKERDALRTAEGKVLHCQESVSQLRSAQGDSNDHVSKIDVLLSDLKRRAREKLEAKRSTAKQAVSGLSSFYDDIGFDKDSEDRMRQRLIELQEMQQNIKAGQCLDFDRVQRAYPSDPDIQKELTKHCDMQSTKDNLMQRMNAVKTCASAPSMDNEAITTCAGDLIQSVRMVQSSGLVKGDSRTCFDVMEKALNVQAAARRRGMQTSSVQKTMQGLTDQRAELQEQVTDLKSLAELQIKEAEEVQSDLDTQKGQCKQMTTKYEGLQAELTSKRDHLACLQKGNKAMEADCLALKKQQLEHEELMETEVSGKKSKLASVRQRLEVLYSEIKEQKEQVSQLEQKAADVTGPQLEQLDSMQQKALAASDLSVLDAISEDLQVQVRDCSVGGVMSEATELQVQRINTEKNHSIQRINDETLESTTKLDEQKRDLDMEMSELCKASDKREKHLIMLREKRKHLSEVAETQSPGRSPLAGV